MAPHATAPRLRVTGSEATGDMTQWREVLVGPQPLVMTHVDVADDGAVVLDTEIVGMTCTSAVAMLRGIADALEALEAEALLSSAGLCDDVA